MLKPKDFFYLQRNDRQAILVLLGIILTCTTLSFVIGSFHSSPAHTEGENESQQARQENSKSNTSAKATEDKPLYYKVDGVPHELFPFDPNTADSTQLLRLGLQAWQVRSIYRYRAKGGIFREPTDFARLYGLTKKQYEVLAPYIRIGEDYRPASDYYGKSSRNYSRANNGGYSPANNGNYHPPYSSHGTAVTTYKPTDEKVYSYPQKLKPGQKVSINHADTTELMKIPGIGSYYAKAIVRYREQLGGFASSSQLQEIEGFPESATAFIHINTSDIRKLNINGLTLNQLRKHPYINFYQAKEICDYRRLRGPIKNIQDLKLLKDFPPAEIERLAPYISF